MKIYKCTIGSFQIKDAFEIVDIFYDAEYTTVSTIEKDKKWIVEILSETPITESSVRSFLKGIYKYDTYEIEVLENIDWLKHCFDTFKPITIGNTFIYGPHLRGKIKIPKNKIAIEIAAATAFGTGEHPTTNKCMIACQSFFDNKVHKKVLDIGCGSGIISIMLAKLGAKNIISCDIDMEAVRVSKENTVINLVDQRVKVFKNNNTEFNREKYDFIIANILTETLISLSKSIVYSMNDNAICIISGFTSNDHKAIEKFQQLGLSLRHIYENDNWSTAVFQKIKNNT